MIHQCLDVSRKQRVEHILGLGLVLEVRRRRPDVLGSLDGNEAAQCRLLAGGADVPGEDDVHPIRIPALVLVGGHTHRGEDITESRARTEIAAIGDQVLVQPSHHVAALASDGDDRDGNVRLVHLAQRQPVVVAVERTAETSICRHQDDHAPAHFAPLEERMLVLGSALHQLDHDRGDLVRIRPRREHSIESAPHPRCSHELHRLRDLLRVLHAMDPSPQITKSGHLGSVYG